MIEKLLEKHDGTKEMLEACTSMVKASDGIVIFGAGVGGRVLYNILREHGLENKVLGFSDNNELKFGKHYCEDRLCIIPPNQLMVSYGKGVDIIIASSAYDSIKAQLMTYGYNNKHIYLYNFAFMELEYTDRDFIYDHLNDFERCYFKLADQKSRRIFLDILNYKITKDSKYLENMQDDVDDEHFQYFASELFEFREDEVFLDIGAYTGDTLLAFINIYEKWKAYIAFEADKDMFSRLNDNAKKITNKGGVELYNFAAWEKEEILHFQANPGSSSVSVKQDQEMVEVQAVSVDDVLGDKSVSLVKMDIEGAECHALVGMRNLIKYNHPILAICVYHLRDDYYKITDFIEETVPGVYSYFFRQYRYTPTETVCFAIPSNRMLPVCIDSK